MSELTPDIAPQVVEACGQNAEDLAGALGRTFDSELTVSVGESAEYSEEAYKQTADGAALVVSMKFGEAGMVAAIPAASGMLPDWCAEPDATGESKLSTMGQELSMLVVPDDLMADDFKVGWVRDLSAAIARVKPAEKAALVEVQLSAGENQAVMPLVWPVEAVDGLLAEPEEAPEEAPSGNAQAAADPEPQAAEQATPAAEEAASQPEEPQVAKWSWPTPSDFSELPPHLLSMLQVPVTVSVNLASKKLAVGEIVDLGPGSIITFDKPCDALLDIDVGGHLVAHGEAVKVGECFGIRVRDVVLPVERFRPMRPTLLRGEEKSAG